MAKKKTDWIDYRKLALDKIAGIFTMVVLCAFPLVYHDYYFDILVTKRNFYYCSVGLMLAAFLVTTFYCWLREWETPDKKLAGSKKWWSKLTWPEWSMVLFLLVAICSTCVSKYKYEAFWGNQGRYTGLFLLLLYGGAFFCVTRFLNYKDRYVKAFLIVGMLVCLFGITDYFQLDILGFKVNMTEEQVNIFTSTMGNINTYTAYVALVLGVSATLFVSAKTTRSSIWYGVALCISFTAIVMGLSDNAYLAIGALFALLPLYCFGSREGIRRYLMMIAIFFTVMQGIDIVNTVAAGYVIGIDSMFSLIAGSRYLLWLVLGLWVLVAVTYAVEHYYGKKLPEAGKLPRRIWIGFLAVAVVAFIVVLLDANLWGHGDRYGGLGSYLVFNDDWGSHRGYIWRIGMEAYGQFPLKRKIFGFGPDTYKIVTSLGYYDEMLMRYNEIFDSAHNEYLQYFITIGPLGLLSYLSLLVSSGVMMVKRAGQNPYVMAILFAVICYGAQAFVNINLPIATPVMWMLLMVGVAACRNKKTGTV